MCVCMHIQSTLCESWGAGATEDGSYVLRSERCQSCGAKQQEKQKPHDFTSIEAWAALLFSSSTSSHLPLCLSPDLIPFSVFPPLKSHSCLHFFPLAAFFFFRQLVLLSATLQWPSPALASSRACINSLQQMTQCNAHVPNTLIIRMRTHKTQRNGRAWPERQQSP